MLKFNENAIEVITSVEPTEEQVNAIYEHVMDIYDNDKNSVQHDMQYGIVQGGCLLVYNGDILKFLESIGFDMFDLENCFDAYDWLVYQSLMLKGL